MKNMKRLPAKSGIYLVTNTINKIQYVGQAKNIYVRFNNHHKTDYLNPKNSCYNTKFYKALRKYGLENFVISIIELCSIEELDKKEIYYIDLYDTYHHGYNSTPGGQCWSPNVHSPEAEEKRYQTREKNQSLKSENHPRAKLTNDEVIKIRQRYIDGESISNIYLDYKDKYNNEAVFKRIVLGKTYISAGNIPNKEQIRHTNAKLTDIQVKEIREKYQKGKISYDALGKEYGLSGSSIAAIVKRKTYKHIN